MRNLRELIGTVSQACFLHSVVTKQLNINVVLWQQQQQYVVSFFAASQQSIRRHLFQTLPLFDFLCNFSKFQTVVGFSMLDTVLSLYVST